MAASDRLHGAELCSINEGDDGFILRLSHGREPGFMSDSPCYPKRGWDGGYGYLAQNTAQISRHALASGSRDDRMNGG